MIVLTVDIKIVDIQRVYIGSKKKKKTERDYTVILCVSRARACVCVCMCVRVCICMSNTCNTVCVCRMSREWRTFICRKSKDYIFWGKKKNTRHMQPWEWRNGAMWQISEFSRWFFFLFLHAQDILTLTTYTYSLDTSRGCTPKWKRCESDVVVHEESFSKHVCKRYFTNIYIYTTCFSMWYIFIYRNI